MDDSNLAKGHSLDAVSQGEKINRGFVFAIIAMALLMNTIDSTIVATALHTLQKELNTTVSWAGWTMTAFSFGFVVMLPISARLSTQYGHRNVFIVSVLVFTIASLLCGLAHDIYTLIIMRVIQAMGGAGITPAATGLIVEHFGSARAQYLGLFGSIFASGVIIGPIFGGIFVTYWAWPWIFFINIPLGLIVILLSLTHIPKNNSVTPYHDKMDYLGLFYLAIAIITAMYSITYLSDHKSSFFSSVFLGVAGCSIVTFILFFTHLKTVSNPFILPRFIFGKGFASVNLFNILFSGMGIGVNSLVPLYAVNRYGMSDLHSGTLLMANGAASVVLSTIMSIYINRTGYRMPLYVGTLIAAIGLALLSMEPLFGISSYVWMIFSTFLMGTGFGMTSPAGRNAGIQLAPEQSANIAAIRSLGMQFGQITAVAVATAIIAGSQHPSHAQAMVYLGLAILLTVLLVPVISRIPETRGAW